MDPVFFSGSEVLKMAVRIEENGEKFYAGAAKASKNGKAKELFNFLLAEEVRHREYFLSLLKEAEKDTTSVFDPYLEEAGLYLKALADSKVFTGVAGLPLPRSIATGSGGQLAKELKDEIKVLEFAIGMEKDSILFYYELYRAVREKEQPTMDKLIGEEKEHLRKLTGLKMELSKE